MDSFDFMSLTVMLRKIVSEQNVASHVFSRTRHKYRKDYKNALLKQRELKAMRGEI